MIYTYLFSVCLLVNMALPAQAGEITATEPAAQPSSTLLVRLKARNVALADVQTITAQLQTRPTRVRLQASRVLRTSYLRKHGQFAKRAARTWQRAERLAAKVQRQLLGKKGAGIVERLRDAARKVSGRRDLSKAMIHRNLDPAVRQLQELLVPTPAHLLTADDNMRKALDELREQYSELQEWFTIYVEMTAGLELSRDADRHFAKYPPPDGPEESTSIDQAFAFAALAGLPMSGQDKQSLLANENLRHRIDHEELLGTLALNRLRYLLGRSLVRIDEKLSDAGRDHSRDMHELGFFSHTSPVQGKQRFGQRAANFGTSASSENIAAGQNSGDGAIRAWWYSPGHHRNMLGGHRRTGLGRHEQLWTQMFGG